jgi:hypothetical protein
MKTLDEFKTFYDEQMLMDLGPLEQRRRQVLNRSIKIFLFALVAIFLLVVIYLKFGAQSTNENTSMYYIIAGIVIVIAAVIVGSTWASDKTFYTDFKTQVVERIVKYISPDLVYEPKNFVGSDSFERSRIFLQGVDRYKGDDMVRGKIDKTQIWFSEVKAEYKTTTTDSKGNRKTTWHTIFQGMFFIADFNKHFQTCTVVLPNKLGTGFLASFFNKMNLTRREKLVKLEDPEFNKHFVVYGEDQIEARYILSTALMQRISEFREKHKGYVFLSFVNSFLHVAISYKKALFEPSYFKKLTDFNLVKEFFEDIHLAVSIVEELNLNNRIWTKQ